MTTFFRRWLFQFCDDLAQMKKIARDPILLAAILLCIASLFLFVVFPLYKVLQQSFFTPEGTFSFDAYMLLFTSGETNTVILGSVVGILATFVGFMFAYCYTYLVIRGKKLFNLVAMLPMISPPFAVALSIILLFGSRGFITNTLLGLRDSNIYGFKGLILVQPLSFFPIAYLLLVGMLKSIDPAIEDAARDLGASRWQTFRRVTAPLVIPGIANSFLLVFIKSVADFANPMAIGGNYATLATQIYIQSIGNYDVQGGAAVAVLLLDLSMLLFIISKYWVEKKVYVTVTGKASRERVSIDDRLVVWPIPGFCYAIATSVLSLYILILIIYLAIFITNQVLSRMDPNARKIELS
jgi:iron(III) transport system permease protein